MQKFTGTGCWPGKFRGKVLWQSTAFPFRAAGGSDRAAEILRLRTELRRALGDLENWNEAQPILEGRLLLQSYRDALHENAWVHRAMALIDTEGLSACEAIRRATQKVSAAMVRSQELAEQGMRVAEIGQWLAYRLDPVPLPSGTVLAAEKLSPLAVLDRYHPAIISSGEPPVLGSQPLVWGVENLGPDWNGRRVAVDGVYVVLG